MTKTRSIKIMSYCNDHKCLHISYEMYIFLSNSEYFIGCAILRYNVWLTLHRTERTGRWAASIQSFGVTLWDWTLMSESLSASVSHTCCFTGSELFLVTHVRTDLSFSFWFLVWHKKLLSTHNTDPLNWLELEIWNCKRFGQAKMLTAAERKESQ